MKTLGAGAAAAVAGPFLADRGEKLYGETLGREALEKELKTLRDRLRDERGIDVDFSSVFPNEAEGLGLKGSAVEYLAEKRELCEALLDALDLYPPFLHRNAGISVVRMMNDMRRDDLEVGVKNQDILGMAERGNDTLYAEFVERHSDGPDGQLSVAINTAFPSRAKRREKFQSTIHHELEHFTEHDAPVDHLQYSGFTRGFRYERNFTGEDLAVAYDFEIEALAKEGIISVQTAVKLLRNYYGFANPYGKTNFFEDRASVAQNLLGSREQRSRLLERTKNDPILLKKVEFMKRHYFEKSFGLMDGMYWDLLEKPESDHKTMAEYLKARAALVGRMSNEEFAASIRGVLGEDVRVDMEAWKAQIRDFAGL